MYMTISSHLNYLIFLWTYFYLFHHIQLLETRQGRCGEYSMLMWRLLLELNYDAKWVIDWADHVSIERNIYNIN